MIASEMSGDTAMNYYKSLGTLMQFVKRLLIWWLELQWATRIAITRPQMQLNNCWV